MEAFQHRSVSWSQFNKVIPLRFGLPTPKLFIPGALRASPTSAQGSTAGIFTMPHHVHQEGLCHGPGRKTPQVSGIPPVLVWGPSVLPLCQWSAWLTQIVCKHSFGSKWLWPIGKIGLIATTGTKSHRDICNNTSYHVLTAYYTQALCFSSSCMLSSQHPFEVGAITPILQRMNPLRGVKWFVQGLPASEWHVWDGTPYFWLLFLATTFYCLQNKVAQDWICYKNRGKRRSGCLGWGPAG